MKVLTKIDGYSFPNYFSDNYGYTKQYDIKGFSLFKFWVKIYFHYFKADRKLKKTLSKKMCYYGPFKGEFGHFTAHTLPFLVYLHKRGVKIIYCGMELHKPFLIDESGNSIVHKFIPLRDFFAEVTPNCNSTIPPIDVVEKINLFKNEAHNSGLPFWDIDDDYYYYFIHRNWLLENHTDIYRIDKFYKTGDENACCIFPRSKGAAFTKNNGEPWDYELIISLIAPYFDKIYICGHPSQVKDIKIQNDKVVSNVSTDNAVMLKAVSNSRLIITQHSGINNVGEFVGTQVLIIYKGADKVEDIGSMNNTLRFRKSLGDKLPLKFAFEYDQIEKIVRELPFKKVA